jgi:hypothetical protein
MTKTLQDLKGQPRDVIDDVRLEPISDYDRDLLVSFLKLDKKGPPKRPFLKLR